MKENKEKVLITGGTGLIGSHLAEKLTDNYEVHIISRSKKNYWRLQEIDDKIQFLENDLSSKEEISKQLLKINRIA